MIQSKSLGSKIFNVFNIILMSLLSLSCLYPLWYTLCLSVSDKAAANSGKVSFYPVGFSLASYQQIMGDMQLVPDFCRANDFRNNFYDCSSCHLRLSVVQISEWISSEKCDYVDRHFLYAVQRRNDSVVHHHGQLRHDRQYGRPDPLRRTPSL